MNPSAYISPYQLGAMWIPKRVMEKMGIRERG